MKAWMNKNWGIVKLAFKDLIIYRADFLMYAVSQIMILIVSYFLWKAIYAYTGTEIIKGFTFQSMINYYVIVMFLRLIVATGIDRTTANKVKDGTLVKDLIRPISYYRFNLLRGLGQTIFISITLMIPVLIAGFLLFGVRQSSYINTGIFAVSAVLAVVLYFTLVLLFGMSSFWLENYSGLSVVRQATFQIFQGSVFPLALLPGAVLKIFNYLPFQYTIYSPIQIFLGNYTLIQSLNILLIQIVWIVILYIAYRIIWSFAIKKFSLVGA